MSERDIRRMLVRRPNGYSFFVTLAEGQTLHDETPGALWGREVVHRCGETNFVVDGNGSCRACRKGGRCKPVRIRLVDLRHAKQSEPPVARPAGRRDRQWYARIYRDELERTLAMLPDGLRQKVEAFTGPGGVFQLAANLCSESIVVAAHRGLSSEDLTTLRSRVYQNLGLSESALAQSLGMESLPVPSADSPEQHFEKCKTACDVALEAFDRFLVRVFHDEWKDGDLKLRSRLASHLYSSWEQLLTNAWLTRTRVELMLK